MIHTLAFDSQNIPECNYDGGDCCSCTCEDTPNQTCGSWSFFSCLDPSAECVNDDDVTADMTETCLEGIGEASAIPVHAAFYLRAQGDWFAFIATTLNAISRDLPFFFRR